MAFNDFDSGFGFQRDLPNLNRIYGNLAKVNRADTVWGSIGRGMAGLDRLNRSGSSFNTAFDAWDRALVSSPLRSAMSAFNQRLEPTGLTAARSAASLDMARTRTPWTALQGLQSSRAQVTHMVTAYDRLSKNFGGLATNFDRLASSYGLATSFDRLAKNAGLLSGLGRYQQTTPFADMAKQLSSLKLLSMTSWNLHQIPPYDMSAFRSVIKAATTYGPVVITPEDDTPPPPSSDYSPSLQGWLIPETATASGDALSPDEAWAEAMAYTKVLTQHYKTKAIVRGIGKDGRTILIGLITAGMYDLIWFLLSR